MAIKEPHPTDPDVLAGANHWNLSAKKSPDQKYRSTSARTPILKSDNNSALIARWKSAVAAMHDSGIVHLERIIWTSYLMTGRAW